MAAPLPLSRSYTLRRKGAYTIRLLSKLIPLSEVQLPSAEYRPRPVPAANRNFAPPLDSSAPEETPENAAALARLSAPYLAKLSPPVAQRLIQEFRAHPPLCSSPLLDVLIRLVAPALAWRERHWLLNYLSMCPDLTSYRW